jgi:cyclopropane fatty-acyl-phospholipid synthase-like methyltransferase
MHDRTDDWWAEAYDRMRELGFYYHYVDFKVAQSEIPFIEAALSLEPESRILDLGCGSGRHAILLAQKGYRVTGIDYSEGSLEIARGEARRQGLDITFRQQDMRTLDEVSSYDAVLVMDCAFGLFDDDENEDVFARVAQSLKPGGGVLLNLFNPYYMAAHQGVRHEVDGSRDFIRHYQFDVQQGRVIDDILCIDAAAGVREAIPTKSYRAYTIPELQRMADSCGIGKLEVYGHDTAFRPLLDKPLDVANCMMMYVVGRKAI